MSLISLGAIFIVTLSVFIFDGLFTKDRVRLDAAIYYAYLPSIIIQKDARLTFLDRENTYKDRVWYQMAPNGGKVLKYTMGVSILLSPFFVTAHFISGLLGENQDGYSLIYQNAVSLGVLLYFFFSLVCLRRVLLTYFSDLAVALTVVSVSIGTNLLWYVTYDGLWAHGLLFSFFCFSIYFHRKWVTDNSWSDFFLFTLCFGLVVLIRPTSSVWILFFVFSTFDFTELRTGVYPVFRRYGPFLLVGALVTTLVFSPQLFYWKYVTGQWFFDPYLDERFVFGRPMIGEFLIGFRKGWFMYTPLMLFAILGVFEMHKTMGYAVALALPLFLSVYILSSWWCWSYGIAWGMRSMVDFYGFMAMPMAAFYSSSLRRPQIVKAGILALGTLLVGFNLFQTWQYKNGLIHFDNMTRQAYTKGLFQLSHSPEWYGMLEPYDYDDRLYMSSSAKGVEHFFSDISETDKLIIKGQNANYLIDHDNYLAGFGSSSNSALRFCIIRVSEDTVVIKTHDGRYLATDRITEEIYFSKSSFPHAERFILKIIDVDGGSGWAFLAGNGKYLMLAESTGFVLASSGIVSKKSLFKVYKVGHF